LNARKQHQIRIAADHCPQPKAGAHLERQLVGQVAVLEGVVSL
jgi:hypothetical protein